MEDVAGVKGAVTHLWMYQPKTCDSMPPATVLAPSPPRPMPTCGRNPAPVTSMWLLPCWRVVNKMAPALIPRPASKKWPSDLYI